MTAHHVGNTGRLGWEAERDKEEMDCFSAEARRGRGGSGRFDPDGEN